MLIPIRPAIAMAAVLPALLLADDDGAQHCESRCRQEQTPHHLVAPDSRRAGAPRTVNPGLPEVISTFHSYGESGRP